MCMPPAQAQKPLPPAAAPLPDRMAPFAGGANNAALAIKSRKQMLQDMEDQAVNGK